MNNQLLLKLKFVRSMGFGVFLLTVILLLAILGTMVPQGRDTAFYAQEYTGYLSDLILLVGLDHLYNSIGFAVLFAALALNLLLCSTTRLGHILKRLKSRYEIDGMQELDQYKLEAEEGYLGTPEQIFKSFGAAGLFRLKYKDGAYFSSKNTLGYFGSWLLHLGIFLVIIFYIYGQATFYTAGLYGIPGETVQLEGTDYMAEIKSFDVSYRPDGSVLQYTTEMNLLNKEGSMLKQGSTNVNNPMRYEGYSFYQTSTGWAVNSSIYKNQKLLKEEHIYEGSGSTVSEENIAVAFNKFYPDFAANEANFFTLSDQPNNPVLLYSIYYRGEVVLMDLARPGEDIVWNEYQFTLEKPMRYSYLQVNKMRGQMGAFIGAMLIMIGLALNFYFKPKEMAIQFKEGVLYIYGRENNDQNHKLYRSYFNPIKRNTKEDVLDVK